MAFPTFVFSIRVTRDSPNNSNIMSEHFGPENTKVENEEKQPMKVFVEVGTNMLPVSFMGTKKFDAQEKYVGFDIKKNEIVSARDMHALARGGENADFIQGSGERLPMKDGSADELLFGNVFGDPSLPASKARLLDEAERVLKVGGKLVIKETNTPFDLEPMRELLRGRALREERTFTMKDKEWANELQQYERTGFAAPNSFLMFLKKLAETHS